MLSGGHGSSNQSMFPASSSERHSRMAPRSAHRLTDRLSVGCVVLVGLDVGFDKLRGDQEDAVAHRDQGSRPVVRATTGFHGNLADGERAEVSKHVGPLQLLPENNLFVTINAVQLKHVLCNIHPNSANLHLGLLLSWAG